MGEPEHRARLIAGYQWMKNNPDNPERHAFLDRFLNELEHYTKIYGAPGENGTEPPPPNYLWREEVAAQLGMDLGDDYTPESNVSKTAGPRTTKKKKTTRGKGYISDRA